MRIRVLGPLEVRRGKRWQQVGAAKLRSILGVLVINAGSPVPVDRLVHELWGDEAPPRDPANLIHVYVGRLRRTIQTPEAPDMLVTRTSGYELALDDDELDSAVFDRLLRQGALR